MQVSYTIAAKWGICHKNHESVKLDTLNNIKSVGALTPLKEKPSVEKEKV